MIDGLSPLVAFVAGVLSFLSPCVLPLLPIVLSSARSRHPLGPLALGAGLAISFTIIGLFVATIGYAIGFDGELFRSIGGVLLAGVGLLLLAPVAQSRLSVAAGPVGEWASGHMAAFEDRGLAGQAVLGSLLGAVWVPCVGPTLGAASLLAAQQENLGNVALVMMAFGLGAAVPLAGIGFASASVRLRLRDKLRSIGGGGKQILGASLLVIGLLIVTDLDRSLETLLTQASPEWLVELTTRY
ncbi:MAG: cytochrome c biogenesis protein CcdA [Sphingomonas sp.]|nr:cytochrome c biogenesis protein CcdA [Sphingomonas sp.]